VSFDDTVTVLPGFSIALGLIITARHLN